MRRKSPRVTKIHQPGRTRGPHLARSKSTEDDGEDVREAEDEAQDISKEIKAKNDERFDVLAFYGGCLGDGITDQATGDFNDDSKSRISEDRS